MSLQVLILAAGLGTRLRPLTQRMPKPLVPLVDASVLAHQVRLARSLGDVRIHANAHYLHAQIEDAATSLGLDRVWVEPELLGSGGPLHRMWEAGERDELLVLNGDCYCQVDLGLFLARARASGASCALLGRSHPAVDTLRLAEDGRLAGLAGRYGAQHAFQNATFTGISWYGPAAWGDIRPGERDIRDFWRRLLETDQAPHVEMADAATTWIDMGDPEGLLSAALCRLGELGLDYWIDPLHAMQKVPAGAFKQAIVHAGAEVGKGARLDQVLLLPGARVEPGEIVSREIRAEGIRWQV